MACGTLPEVHEASFEKVRAFRNAYLRPEPEPIRVLDIGSAQVNSRTLSYRDLFTPPDFDYLGLDLAPGENVDFVPADPYCWDEIASDSFDVAVCGQAFEHSPYFWITAAEIARVLRPGGYAVVIAPSTGHIHRFPLDCWRFYPDAWRSICTYVGLDLVEAMRERPTWRLWVPGLYWYDAMMIARKPQLEEPAARAAFGERLAAIAATRTVLPPVKPGPGRLGTPPGPAITAYESAHTLPSYAMVRHPARVLSAAWGAAGRRIQLKLRPLRVYFEVRHGKKAVQRGHDAMPWPPVGK